MASFRFPATLGSGLSTFIDAGTLVRGFSCPPGMFEPANHLRLWAAQQMRDRLRDGIQQVGQLAYAAVMDELRDLHGGIEEKLEYLSSLPGEMRDQAAYDFFAAFFDHYLPKKFLRNYIWGHGQPIKLTLQEMIDCNPVINLNKSGPFTRRLQNLQKDAAATGRTVTYPFTLEMVAGAATNGTLGQFTVAFSGKIVVEVDGSWTADGVMEFKDTWDFDPKDSDKGGRSAQGETKTRFGNAFLPGTAFDISSESTPFSQTQDNDLVVWAGGRPKKELDKVSQSDVSVAALFE